MCTCVCVNTVLYAVISSYGQGFYILALPNCEDISPMTLLQVLISISHSGKIVPEGGASRLYEEGLQFEVD